MTEPTSSSPFINSANKQMYGKIPLQSWVGKVVSYDQQTEQLDTGWGWRYKVRILGDNSNVDQVKEDELSYALCLLPTTAGSGAAHKLRSVRISQGDMVFGFVGGDGPRYIIGVFPRTSKSSTSKGKFGTLSGFYGSLEDKGILTGEFNEQTGPKTPEVTPIGPEEYSKAERKDPSEKIEEFGINKDQKEEITEEQVDKLDVKETKEEWNPNKQEIKDSSKINTPSDSIVTRQIKDLLTDVDDNKKQSIINKINPLKKIKVIKGEKDITNEQIEREIAAHKDYIEKMKEEGRNQKKIDFEGKKLKTKEDILKFRKAGLPVTAKMKFQFIDQPVRTEKSEEKKTKEVYDKEYSDHVVSAIKQGIKQNLLDKDSAQSAINAVRRGDYNRANLILFPPGPPTTG